MQLAATTDGRDLKLEDKATSLGRLYARPASGCTEVTSLTRSAACPDQPNCAYCEQVEVTTTTTTTSWFEHRHGRNE
jgi:histone acetyltransferase (RNA polymerase elongator complex component)